MAKPRARTSKRHGDSDDSPAATLENETEAANTNGDDNDEPRYRSHKAPTKVGGGGLFNVYKRNQGRNTRLGTAVGAAIIVGGFVWYLYDLLEVYDSLYVQAGVAAAVGLVLGLLAYWLIGVHHRASDFLIATDGELKKVNWSSKKEVIGSTKVVIFTTLLMAVVLFFVDIVFLKLFQFIGVWEATG
jgi:preprotein translocase SecE subunit